MKLLLFDIDGTLLLSGGASRVALNRAFSHVFGYENGLQDVSMMGRTDPLIMKEVLDRHDLPWDENRMKTFQQVYYQFLEQEMQNPETVKTRLPGIDRLLEILSKDEAFVLGVLTGNWEHGATIKLRHFNLQHYFQLGAYASDEAERHKLVPVALKKFEQRFQQTILPDNVYVIGDTPLDIIAARPHGVRTVAVATGYHDKESIQKENPDIIYDNFSDIEQVVSYFRNS